MHVKQRVSLAEAEALANDLVELLGHGCKRIVIAGSIRRRRAYVGDIDLLCEPIVTEEFDLFGFPTGNKIDRLDDAAEILVADGKLVKRLDSNGRACWGRVSKRATFKGLSVDINAATDPDAWGAWLVIRTGPAEFGKRLVTRQTEGGWLPDGMRFRNGFQLHRGLRRIPTPTEEAVFQAIGMDFIPPHDRA